MAEAKKNAKPALTPQQIQEQSYQQARNMESWIQWAASWQDRSELCQQAADAYEKLGDYQDAPQRRAACLARREQALSTDRDEAFQLVRQELEQARTAQDYYYAAQKLERFAEDMPEAKQLLARAKKRRKSLLRGKRLMRRGAMAAVVLLLGLMMVLYRLHIPQYAIGRVFQAAGSYNHALEWYNRSGTFADAKDRVVFCRYQRGLYFQNQGKYQAAYQKFRETRKYEDSQERCIDCIIALLSQSQPGDKVKLGKVEGEFPQWMVLENDGKQVTLIADFSQAMKFDQQRREWLDSALYEWLNTEFLDTCFVDFEQDLLVNPTGEGDGKVYILSQEEFKRYRDLLKGTDESGKSIDEFKVPAHGYWLRTPADNGVGQMMVQYWNDVDPYGMARTDGGVHVRPVITVSISD